MIGFHISKESGKLTLAAEIVKNRAEFGIETAQIFTHGPKGKGKNKTGIEGPIRGMRIYAHSPYSAIGMWENPKNYVEYLRSELGEAERIGLKGVVFHLKDISPEIIADSLEFLSKKVKFGVPILLEMPAKRATETSYDKVSNLNALGRLIDGMGFEWGWCVDTAHLWAYGHDVRSAKYMRRWLRGLEHPVRLIHLNSNLLKNFGTGKDNHVIPLSEEDYIWREYLDSDNMKESGIYYLVKRYAKKNKIDCIVEHKKGDATDLRACLELFN